VSNTDRRFPEGRRRFFLLCDVFARAGPPPHGQRRWPRRRRRGSAFGLAIALLRLRRRVFGGLAFARANRYNG